MSLETTKAATIIGNDRSTKKDIEEQCEVVITKEPGQGGQTILSIKGNKTTNASRMIHKAVQQGEGHKEGAGGNLPPKKKATQMPVDSFLSLFLVVVLEFARVALVTGTH